MYLRFWSSVYIQNSEKFRNLGKLGFSIFLEKYTNKQTKKNWKNCVPVEIVFLPGPVIKQRTILGKEWQL